jgi:hypothetical protein
LNTCQQSSAFGRKRTVQDWTWVHLDRTHQYPERKHIWPLATPWHPLPSSMWRKSSRTAPHSQSKMAQF